MSPNCVLLSCIVSFSDESILNYVILLLVAQYRSVLFTFLFAVFRLSEYIRSIHRNYFGEFRRRQSAMSTIKLRKSFDVSMKKGCIEATVNLRFESVAPIPQQANIGYQIVSLNWTLLIFDVKRIVKRSKNRINWKNTSNVREMCNYYWKKIH